MAALGGSVKTLGDITKELDPGGRAAVIAEILHQSNELLMDIPFVPANLPTGHQITQRTSLPTPTWRKYNEAVTPTKSTSVQLVETMGMLEDWSEIDIKLAKVGNDEAGARLNEAKAHIEGMGQEFAQTMWYGDRTVNPQEFDGFKRRYDSLSGTISQNVISASATASGSTQCSIWLICWDDDKIYGIYPPGSKAGLDHMDHGEQSVTGTAGLGGSRIRVFQDQYTWDGGLAVKDWRCAVRICNLDTDELAGATPPDIPDAMIKATYRIPNLEAGRCMFYMNRTIRQWLHIQQRNDVSGGGQLGYEVVDGKKMPTFLGVPIRISDQLITTEEVVT